MKYGYEIEKTCKQCQVTELYRPKDFHAVSSLKHFILSLLILIFSLVLLKDWMLHFFNDNKEWMNHFPSTYFEIGLLLILPIIIFMLFRYEQEKSVRLFNKS